MINGIRPQDVLPEDQDYKTIAGIKVRKGTIAAAMRNIELLESGSPDEAEAARMTLNELAPSLIVLGVHKHFKCRNPNVEEILAAAANTIDAKPRDPA